MKLNIEYILDNELSGRKTRILNIQKKCDSIANKIETEIHE
jgi:hypothetical protein